MDTTNFDPKELRIFNLEAKFGNVVAGNVEVMKQAHDALLAFGRPCNGTDAAIIALRKEIESSENDLREV